MSSSNKTLCPNCNQLHIIYDGLKETDEDDNEWSRHTQTYQDGYDAKLDENTGWNYEDGMIIVCEWIQKNHDVLCCPHRHECLHFE